MKFPLRPLNLAGVFVLVSFFLLGGESALPAQSTRRHKKTSVEDSDASPTPLPSPSPKAGVTAPEGTKKDAVGAPKPGDQPSTADEAAPSKTAAPSGNHPAATAATSSIDPAEIENFDAQSAPVRQLLAAALDLAKRNLTYTYGSADPAAGGMDCSGTMYYLLRQRGFDDVPRQASEQYSWVREKSRLYAVVSKKQDTAELREMRPGDLLFWTGTYNVDRDPPVTHTMLYLGRRQKDGHRLMFGASDGRPYDGQRRNGVSVFDFKMPAARNGDAADASTAAAPDHAPDFAGYGPIPGIVDLSDAASRQTAAEHATPTPATKDAGTGEDTPTPSSKPKRTHSSPKPRT